MKPGIRRGTKSTKYQLPRKRLWLRETKYFVAREDEDFVLGGIFARRDFKGGGHCENPIDQNFLPHLHNLKF